jgi:hypothetical protein
MTETLTETPTVAATVLFDAETYVARGLSPWGVSDQAWADRFTALGGTACLITPAWRYGNPPALNGRVKIGVEGTEAALAYVIACATA